MSERPFFFLCASLALASVACASGSKNPGPAQQVEPGSEKQAPAVAAEDEGPPPFDVLIEHWEGPAGEEAQVLVTVKAKQGFKINDKYPHKVKLDAPPAGLTVPMLEITKEHAQLSGDQSITYTIPATAAKAGQYQLNGVVKLSVCSQDQCRMAKEKMTASVTAQ